MYASANAATASMPISRQSTKACKTFRISWTITVVPRGLFRRYNPLPPSELCQHLPALIARRSEAKDEPNGIKTSPLGFVERVSSSAGLYRSDGLHG
jgi:hypothetical protein